MAKSSGGGGRASRNWSASTRANALSTRLGELGYTNIQILTKGKQVIITGDRPRAGYRARRVIKGGIGLGTGTTTRVMTGRDELIRQGWEVRGG